MCVSPLFTYSNLWRVCPVCWFLALFNYHFQPLSTPLPLPNVFDIHCCIVAFHGRPNVYHPFLPPGLMNLYTYTTGQRRVSIFSSPGRRGLIPSFGRGGVLVYWRLRFARGLSGIRGFIVLLMDGGLRDDFGGVNRRGWEMWERSFGIFRFNRSATKNVFNKSRDCTNQLDSLSFFCNLV